MIVLVSELCEKIDGTHNTTCLESLPALAADDGSLNENYKVKFDN